MIKLSIPLLTGTEKNQEKRCWLSRGGGQKLSVMTLHGRIRIKPTQNQRCITLSQGHQRSPSMWKITIHVSQSEVALAPYILSLPTTWFPLPFEEKELSKSTITTKTSFPRCKSLSHISGGSIYGDRSLLKENEERISQSLPRRRIITFLQQH